MRALYYIALPAGGERDANRQAYTERVKANENCLNQNFTQRECLQQCSNVKSLTLPTMTE